MNLFIGSLAYISCVNALEKSSGGEKVLYVSKNNDVSPSYRGNGRCDGTDCGKS